jgi:hypothetical protein
MKVGKLYRCARHYPPVIPEGGTGLGYDYEINKGQIFMVIAHKTRQPFGEDLHTSTLLMADGHKKLIRFKSDEWNCCFKRVGKL